MSLIRTVLIDVPDLIVLIWWRIYILIVAIGGLACWMALIALLIAEVFGVRWGW